MYTPIPSSPIFNLVVLMSTIFFFLLGCGGGSSDGSQSASDDSEGSSVAEAAGRIATGMSAPDPTPVDIDLCTLLTSEDLTSYLDGYRESVEEASHGWKSCRHEGGSFTNVRLEIGGMDLDGFEQMVSANHALMDDVEMQEISGLGDKAYYLRSLWVHSGEYVFQVDVNGTRPVKRSPEVAPEIATEIAEIVLARL